MRTIKTIEVLTANEQADLDRLEALVNGAFHEIGQAWAEIRDRRLYRAQYHTFEEYCADYWGKSKTQVNRLISAAAVVENLTPMGVRLPSNERQCRPLTTLEPEQQAEVWVETLQRTSQPTAKDVQETIDRVQQRGNITPGSKVRVVEGEHAGKEVEVKKAENGGKVVYANVNDETYPFLVGEVEVIEPAPAPAAPKPKIDLKAQNQILKDLLCRCLPYLPADLMAEVESAIE